VSSVDGTGDRLDGLMTALDRRLADADAALGTDYPGDRGVRQPVHTVYVPADRYGDQTVAEWSAEAKQVLAQYGESAVEVAEAMGLQPGLAVDVHDRVRLKLDREPIEDLRIDFEDGYGVRPDEDEDQASLGAAAALARSVLARTAPPFHGVRIKCLEAPTRRRAVRTLDLVVGELVDRGALTPGFVVTLPKVTSVAQVEAMVTVLDALETAHDLPPGTLTFEIQVETPQAILGADGTALVAPMIHAAGGRCTGLHYGTYDYSASLGVSAQHQSMEHPVADHAKAVMQVAAAGTGVAISDGSTNVLPVGGRDAVQAAWRLHVRLVRRSLAQGIYQGWDLHPAQLPSRYVAVYAFFREGLDQAAARLRAYVHGGDSGFLDEPATAVALAGFVLRGLECGAVDLAEVDKLIGIDLDGLARLARRPID
jgi:citrate lyase beta subunit